MIDSSYGDRVADFYDEQHGHLDSDDPAIVWLAGLAAPGNRALELGVVSHVPFWQLAARKVLLPDGQLQQNGAHSVAEEHLSPGCFVPFRSEDLLGHMPPNCSDAVAGGGLD